MTWLLVIMVIAHFIADVITQTPYIRENKTTEFKAILLHGCHHFIVMMVLVLLYDILKLKGGMNFGVLVIISGFLALFHMVQDYCLWTFYYELREFNWKNSLYMNNAWKVFLTGDQIMHFGFIFIAYMTLKSSVT